MKHDPPPTIFPSISNSSSSSSPSHKRSSSKSSSDIILPRVSPRKSSIQQPSSSHIHTSKSPRSQSILRKNAAHVAAKQQQQQQKAPPSIVIEEESTADEEVASQPPPLSLSQALSLFHSWRPQMGCRLSDTAHIVSITTPSPASQAHLHINDHILSWNDVDVDITTLTTYVRETRPGERCMLRIKRGEDIVHVMLEMGAVGVDQEWVRHVRKIVLSGNTDTHTTSTSTSTSSPKHSSTSSPKHSITASSASTSTTTAPDVKVGSPRAPLKSLHTSSSPRSSLPKAQSSSPRHAPSHSSSQAATSPRRVSQQQQPQPQQQVSSSPRRISHIPSPPRHSSHHTPSAPTSQRTHGRRSSQIPIKRDVGIKDVKDASSDIQALLTRVLGGPPAALRGMDTLPTPEWKHRRDATLAKQAASRPNSAPGDPLGATTLTHDMALRTTQHENKLATQKLAIEAAKAELATAKKYIGMEIIDGDGDAVRVCEVKPGYSAQQAGLLISDHITHVNGLSTRTRAEFAKVMSHVHVGETLRIIRRPRAGENDTMTHSVFVGATNMSNERIIQLRCIVASSHTMLLTARQWKEQRAEERVEKQVHVETENIEQHAHEIVEKTDMAITMRRETHATTILHGLPPYLGVEIIDGPKDVGVRAIHLIPTGPAAIAGLQNDDIITHLANQATPDRQAFERVMRHGNIHPGDHITLNIIRDNAKMDITIEVGSTKMSIEKIRELKQQIDDAKHKTVTIAQGALSRVTSLTHAPLLTHVPSMSSSRTQTHRPRLFSMVKEELDDITTSPRQS